MKVTRRVKIELHPRVGEIFSVGRILIFLAGKGKISNITVLNYFLAVNCPMPTPSPFWHFSREATTAPGG